MKAKDWIGKIGFLGNLGIRTGRGNVRSAVVSRLLLGAIAIAFLLKAAAGQETTLNAALQWNWNSFDTQNSDLPGNDVRVLAIGPKGELWIGTSRGLGRLQEGRWEIFYASHSGLLSDDVQALAVGKAGQMWVGTSRGLGLLQDGRWVGSFTSDSGLPSEKVQALAISPAGDLWVGTSRGLALRHKGGWDVFRAGEGSLPAINVQALAMGQEGELWVGTSRGLALLKNGQWEFLSRYNVQTLLVGKKGELWVGTGPSAIGLGFGLSIFSVATGGLSCLKEGRWEVFDARESNLPANDVRALAQGAEGELWVGTTLLADHILFAPATRNGGGGALARLQEGQWKTFTAEESGLPGNNVQALAVAPGGALWLGTQSGLARLQEGQWKAFTTEEGGLPSDSVGALAMGRAGELWVGTSRGLGYLKNDSWEAVVIAKSGLSNAVRALAVGSEGELWVGTGRPLLTMLGVDFPLGPGGGLARLKDGVWVVYTAAKGGLPGGDVRALAVGSEGELWVGTGQVGSTGGGLARLKNENWDYSVSLPTRVQALAVTPKGELWVGSLHSGLARLKEGQWESFNAGEGLPSNNVQALRLGPEGDLWVGTGPDSSGIGGGLACLKEEQWSVFTAAEGLPSDDVRALAVGLEGELWVGTLRGLARLKDGELKDFTTASSGLQNDEIEALAVEPDGIVWVGTSEGGLATFRPPAHRPRIVDLVGANESDGGRRVTQLRHTFAVIPYDPNYLTEGTEWRFAWRLDKPTGATNEIESRSSFYEAVFEQEGRYRLSVEAIDEYGSRSEPREYDFHVALPKESSVEIWARRLMLGGGILSSIYFLALFPLLLVYPGQYWARTFVNSGIFTKFPVLHRVVLNSSWARKRLFHCLAKTARAEESVPAHYIPQTLFHSDGATQGSFSMDGTPESLAALFEQSRLAMLLSRSGTGKSVLLRFLQRELSARFLDGTENRLPILLDMRINPIAGRTVEALVRDALAGGGVDLPEKTLDYLIQKGNFLLLIDSLNELPDRQDAQAFHPFLNRDAANFTLIASQMDLLRRPDFAVYRLAEVTPGQARSYLQEAVGRDVWDSLPPEARALSRNPQDLDLLSEVIAALGSDRPLPSRRADLYREILNHDTLAKWARAGNAQIQAIYAIAFRMVQERRVIGEEQMREWLRKELSDQDAFSEKAMSETMEAIARSRLFREEREKDIIGKERPVAGFRHELVGKFLASRHVREVLTKPDEARRKDYIRLGGDEEWLDVYFFIVDELNSRAQLNTFLKELLKEADDVRLRIVAYALGTKPEDRIAQDVRNAYASAKLDEDLKLTPLATRTER